MEHISVVEKRKQHPEPGKQILVAVDGSVYSAYSLHYLGKLFKNVTSITFHLLAIIPHKMHDTQRAWVDQKNIKLALDPHSRESYDKAELCLQQAKGILRRHGLAEEQIVCNVQMTYRNVADDLLKKARNGMYDALLIGRRGLGMIQEIVLGSVSKNILEKCHDVPIWLIDGQVDSNKFLVPIDGTKHSLRAVDHLAFILRDNPDAEVTFFNSPDLFGERPQIPPADSDWDKQWSATNMISPKCLFNEPTSILAANGFSNDRIHHLCSPIGIHASRQIIRQALADEFGTIVIGRRPATIAKGVFGGVTDQIIHMADQMALWIVG